MSEHLGVQVPKRPHSSPGSLHTFHKQLNASSTPIGDTVLTDTQDGDPPVPDYKPFALRWPFLTTILLFICSLIILVIVGLQRLPIQKSTSFAQVLQGRQVSEREFGVVSGAAVTEHGTYIPQAKSPSYQDSTDAIVISQCQDWYLVCPEDSCTSIATAHNTTTEQLYAWNPSIRSQSASLEPHSWLCVNSPSFAASLAPRQLSEPWPGVPPGVSGPWPSRGWNDTARERYGAIVTTASTITDSMTRSTATKREAATMPSPLSNHAGTTAHLTTPCIAAIKPAKSPDVSTCSGDLVSNKAGRRAKQGRTELNPVGQHSGSNVSSQTTSMAPRPTVQTRPGTVHHVSVGSYFANMFMPVLLGTLLHIPVHILAENVKLFQPLHEMTQREGASARHSLLFSTFSWRYRAASLRQSGLRYRSLLPLLTLALDVAANISTALSAIAFGFQLKGGCHRGDPASVARGCGLEPSIFLIPALLLISSLAVMGLMVCTGIFVLARWRTGVSRNPWSIFETRALGLHQGLRKLLRPLDQGSGSSDSLKSNMFTLGYFRDEQGQQRYGIIPCASVSATCATDPLNVSTGHDVNTGTDNTMEGNPDAHGLYRSSQPAKARLPIALGYVERSLFLVLLSGLIILIVYYHNVNRSSSFEDFMDSETFGVKFLFTLLGTVITSFWWSFFETIAIISPYRCLSSSAKTTLAASLAVSRPTNAFSGFHASLKHRDPFLAVVSLVAMVAEFLPMFLANVPFNMSELKVVYEFSYWVTLCVVCIMVLLIAASFLIRWTRLPVDPSTLAGAIYLAMDRNFLGDLATSMDDEDQPPRTTAKSRTV